MFRNCFDMILLALISISKLELKLLHIMTTFNSQKSSQKTYLDKELYFLFRPIMKISSKLLLKMQLKQDENLGQKTLT